MTTSEKLAQYFRSEVRNAGRRFFDDEKVSTSQLSELEVQAYIRGSSTSKVSLRSASFDSELLTADCTCLDSQKGRLCKHVWAVLLKLEQTIPDFVNSKSGIEKFFGKNAAGLADRPDIDKRVAAQRAAKAKKASYLKAQYIKQKERAREMRLAKKSHAAVKLRPLLPEAVEAALGYFASNGFTMQSPLDASKLALAKKQLSRVFHPDKGGTHEEILRLNESYNVLLAYMND